MNLNTNIPGLKDVIIEKIGDVGEPTALYVSLPKKAHTWPNYGERNLLSHVFYLKQLKNRNNVKVGIISLRGCEIQFTEREKGFRLLDWN